jgi:hypothetical protein
MDVLTNGVLVPVCAPYTLDRYADRLVDHMCGVVASLRSAPLKIVSCYFCFPLEYSACGSVGEFMRLRLVGVLKGLNPCAFDEH